MANCHSTDSSEAMVGALLALAFRASKNTTVPFILLDSARMIRRRLIIKKWRSSSDRYDYFATLGWVFGLWEGALPYVDTCELTGVNRDILRDVVLSTPQLKADLDLLRRGVA